MKNSLLLSLIALSSVLCCSSVMADNVNIYINNNNSQNPTRYASDIMCTRHGAICANNGFVLSTSGVIYAPSQWKRPTIRERKLSYEANKYSVYEY